jgi:hypothetical protein
MTIRIERNFMKSKANLFIALLTSTAIVLACLLALGGAPKTSRADVLDSSTDFQLITSSSMAGQPDVLNVVDCRDGLLLMYRLDGRHIHLINAFNLNPNLHMPSRP